MNNKMNKKEDGTCDAQEKNCGEDEKDKDTGLNKEKDVKEEKEKENTAKQRDSSGKQAIKPVEGEKDREEALEESKESKE